MKIRLLFTYSVVNYMYIFVTFKKLPPQWQLFNSLLFSPDGVVTSIALKKKRCKSITEYFHLYIAVYSRCSKVIFYIFLLLQFFLYFI